MLGLIYRGSGPIPKDRCPQGVRANPEDRGLYRGRPPEDRGPPPGDREVGPRGDIQSRQFIIICDCYILAIGYLSPSPKDHPSTTAIGPRRTLRGIPWSPGATSRAQCGLEIWLTGGPPGDKSTVHPGIPRYCRERGIDQQLQLCKGKIHYLGFGLGFHCKMLHQNVHLLKQDR